MPTPIARLAFATLMLPVVACAQAPHAAATPLPYAKTLASILETCWAAPELKSGRSTSFSSHNSDFDQKAGAFHAEVQRPSCRTSVEAWGPVANRAGRDNFTHLDSLTLRFSNDTITAVLHEQSGKQSRLTVNGREASTDWWQAGSRERVLRLAQVPLR